MRCAILLAAMTVALTAMSARAEERSSVGSPYEQKTIDRAVAKLHATVDPRPQGKVLEAVDVVSLDVFEDRDLLPSFLAPVANWFHTTTRPYVIEREVLLRKGDRYDQALVDETARNLRGLTQLSLVLCVPLRGSTSDRVRLLIITKDVWSLRLNSDFTFVDGRLQYLLLQPSELNLLGSHQQILGTFEMDAATISVGGAYIIPRLAGSRVAASATATGIVNRETGHAEGSSGSLSYGQPLYSTRAAWAWRGRMSWEYKMGRRFIGGLGTVFDPASSKCVVASSAATNSSLPRCEYHRDVVSGDYTVTRSFGSTIKHDVSLAFEVSRRQFRRADLSPFTGDQRAAFERAVMPVSDTQIGPSIAYHTYSTRYFDVLDYASLGLTESYPQGHDVTLKLTPITKALNSSRNFVMASVSATYTVPVGDGLVRALVSSDNELTVDGIPDGSVSAGLRVVTPRFGHGRLVFAASVLDRYRNYLNSKTKLGGNGRLRGYPTDMFEGKDYVIANLEYRSDPVEVLAVQLGFVVFADVGDAFDGFSDMRLKQSAGFGMRAVFPQLQRSVMRVDVGFPLTQGALSPGKSSGNVVVTFDQAF